jgi:arabinogalactan endo-1,4-beta-galactosidase
MRGADISIQTRQEEDGVVYNEDGVAKDVLTIFKNHDLNWIRIRIFNDPSAAPQQYYGASQDLDYVTELAGRIKAEGFKFLLDFHYSDTWADPGNQSKPAAWESLSQAELVTAIGDYTQDVIEHLRDNDVMPEMIQVGNEINCGMLWPNGNPCSGGSWSNLAALINSAIDGIDDGRGAEPMPEIMIHIAKGGDWSGTQWFFDNLIAYGVQFDVIGQSFYPEWHGTFDDLTTCLNGMAGRYSQDIVIVEAGDYYAYSGTPESQKAYLEGLIQRVQETPDGKGTGVFYWEPTWVWEAGGVGGRALFEPISENWRNVDMLMAMEAFDITGYLTCQDVIDGGDGLVSDINGDCYVDFLDFSVMAYYWLYTDCAMYSNCEGADIEPPDGTVGLGDFGDFAIGWTQCNHPQDPNCTPSW